MLIDTHAHLCSKDFESDLPVVLERAKFNLQKIINIATTPEELKKALSLKEDYSWIYSAAATTPHDVATDGDAAFTFFESQAQHLVAIGETGLDYYYEHSPKDIQQTFFKKYIRLAKKTHLPLIIHCRDAFGDLFRIFDEENYKGKAVLHCFTGTLEEAQEGIKRSFFISFSGIVTFKKSQALQEIATKIPLESLLIETDCPYLAPQSKRGQRNEPSFIVETAQFLAQLKGVAFNEFCSATTANASSLFNI